MELDIPDWLTQEFLKNLLENNQPGGKKYTVDIIKHEVFRRVPKGTNYLSNLLGVNIDFTKVSDEGSEIDRVSLVVKAPLTGDALCKLNNCGVVEREVEAYYELFPKMNEIITKDGDEPLMPKCYRCDVESVTVLEDLKLSGYKMLDKRKQMGYDLAVVTLKHIAKFHAASVKLHETESELVERVGRHLLFTNPMDPEIKSMLDPILGEEHLDKLCVEFDKYPETKKYVKFLSKLKPKTWEHFLQAIERDDEFNVLAHGDVYTNNMLYLFDNKNTVRNIKFVDYQTLRYSSPATDVHNYLATSVKYDVIVDHYHELITTYLQCLNIYLGKYGSNRSLDEEIFKRSIEKRELYGLLLRIYYLPFTFAGYEEITDSVEPPEIIQPDYPYFEFSQTLKYRTTILKYFDMFSCKSWFRNIMNT